MLAEPVLRKSESRGVGRSLRAVVHNRDCVALRRFGPCQLRTTVAAVLAKVGALGRGCRGQGPARERVEMPLADYELLLRLERAHHAAALGLALKRAAYVAGVLARGGVLPVDLRRLTLVPRGKSLPRDGQLRPGRAVARLGLALALAAVPLLWLLALLTRAVLASYESVLDLVGVSVVCEVWVVGRPLPRLLALSGEGPLVRARLLRQSLLLALLLAVGVEVVKEQVRVLHLGVEVVDHLVLLVDLNAEAAALLVKYVVVVVHEAVGLPRKGPAARDDQLTLRLLRVVALVARLLVVNHQQRLLALLLDEGLREGPKVPRKAQIALAVLA